MLTQNPPDDVGMGMAGRHPNGYTPLPDNSYNQYNTPPHPSQQSGYAPYNTGGPQPAPSLHSSNQQQKMIPGYAYSSGEGTRLEEFNLSHMIPHPSIPLTEIHDRM